MPIIESALGDLVTEQGLAVGLAVFLVAAMTLCSLYLVRFVAEQYIKKSEGVCQNLQALSEKIGVENQLLRQELVLQRQTFQTCFEAHDKQAALIRQNTDQILIRIGKIEDRLDKALEILVGADQRIDDLDKAFGKLEEEVSDLSRLIRSMEKS
jgi:hypothetical protein